MPTAIHNTANAFRRLIDERWKYPPVLLVVLLGVLSAVAVIAVQKYSACRHAINTFSSVDLQLTFSGQKFLALLSDAHACGSQVDSWLFPLLDTVFACCYTLLLIVLYVWVERWLRFQPGTPSDVPRRPPVAPSVLMSMLVLLPVAVALADTVLENIPLFAAAVIDAPTPVFELLVLVGSVGAALKWSLLALFLLALLTQLLRGPRGIVVWRVRYSVLAVMLGALPLLAIPQGQDILQRLVEGARPRDRIVFALLFLTLAAVVNWYSARTLSRVRFSHDALQTDPWYSYFEQRIPRVLGVATLALTALAFARAGNATAQFSLAGGAGYLLGIALGDRRARLGNMIIGNRAYGDHLVADRIGRACVGMLTAVLAVYPASVGGAQGFHVRYGPATKELLYLRAGAAALLMTSWVLFLFVYTRHDFALIRAGHGEELAAFRKREDEELARGFTPDVLPADVMRRLIVSVAISLALFLAFTYATVPVARTLGPLVVVALTVANAVLFGSIIAYAGRKYRVPIVPVALGFAAVLSFWNDNHAIRTLPADATTDARHGKHRLSERLDAWLAGHMSAGDSISAHDTTAIPLILVAASGGGLRAAYWTALALATLQDRDTSFASHVFAISGVSGGSLGGAVFSAMMHDRLYPAAGDTVPGCLAELQRTQPLEAARNPSMVQNAATLQHAQPLTACIKRYMGDDFLAPVLAKFVTADFTQWFVPIPIARWDRSLALEESWEDSYAAITGAHTMTNSFSSLMNIADAGRGVPALLINTTHVESGRRYIMSPFTDDSIFLDAPDVDSVLGYLPVRLSTAAHNSARFTYVSPAGRIDRGDGLSYGSLVDGGYFENSGLATLNEPRVALDNLTSQSSGRDALSRAHQRIRITVVYLCNDPLSCKRDISTVDDLRTPRELAAEWFAPVRALLGARTARGSLARQQLTRQVLKGRFFQINVCDSLHSDQAVLDSVGHDAIREKSRDRVINPPLGWLLSAQARRWMDSSLTPVQFRGVVDSASVTYDAHRSCPERNVHALDSLAALLRKP